MKLLPDINWRIRFSRHNGSFIFRFISALLIPILAYMGLQFEDFTTWMSVWEAFLGFISNPFLVFLTAYNAFNMIPDGTTPGIEDSKRSLNYNKPGGFL